MNFEEVLTQLSASEEIIFTNELLGNLPTVVDQANWLNFAKRAVAAIKNDKYFQANLLLKNLSGQLLNSDENIRHEYEPIMVWLSYAAWENLSDGEVEIFFSKHDFSLLLKDDLFFNLHSKVRLWLASRPIEERDELRERIYNAIQQNDYIFTKSFITEGERGSVANWLKEYNKSVGFGLANALNRVEFENQSIITAHLDDLEKSFIKKLFDFYEYIKLSSVSIVGLEDDFVMDFKGNTYLYTEGQEILAAPEINEKSNIKFSNPVVSSEIAFVRIPVFLDITKQSQAYLLSTNGEITKVLNELKQALANGNVLGVTGVLMLLAQLRRLDDILIDEPSFRVLVAQDLEKSGQAVQREGLAAKPNAPQFLARFLKVLLQDNLHINPDEAMKFGERLGKLLFLEGEAYRKMILVDDSGIKRWNV